MPRDDATSIDIASRLGRRTLVVPPGQRQRRLTDLLRTGDLPLNTRCGQRGLCDGCLVELHHGRLRHHETGELITANGQAVTVPACQYMLTADNATRLRLPDRSLLAYRPQVVDEFRLTASTGHNPLGPPTATATLGAAVDVGTTTVAALLVDLATGAILARASAFNRQMHLGDDVLTRIELCGSRPGSLAELQRQVVTHTFMPLLVELLGGAARRPEELACVAIAGNTTMLHLFAGVDPTPMGVLPFTPAFLEHRQLDAADLSPVAQGTPELAPQLHLLPGAAAYIGADLTAGVVATNMLYAAETSLLVDVGTNGEIILKHGDQLFACATAAGPAFEGARLSCGMRAGDGAISHIRFGEHARDVDIEVVGGSRVKPAGLCGSAYLDLLAEARRVDLLTAAGRFMPEHAGERLIHDEHLGRCFQVARGQGKRAIVVSECDIAALLQAKAAIAAGILTLLRHAGLEPTDIRTLHLAGGFGMHIDVANAIAVGLLPGFRSEQVRVVGNTALAGAYLALLDRGLIDEMARVADRLRIIELNQDPAFESHFIDALALPAVRQESPGIIPLP